MSEIQVGQINSTDGSTAITTGADGYVSFAKTQIGGRRNLIINGAMQVAQRGTSFSSVSDGTYTIDRWAGGSGSFGTWSVDQSTDAPTGFPNSYKLTCTSSASLGSGSYVRFYSTLEGQDLQHLAFGTSSAKQLTLSFWVKSNKTGSLSAFLRSIESSPQVAGELVSISSADTWEYKTVTLNGDTANSFDNDNNGSLQIQFWFNGGSTYSGGTITNSFTSSAASKYYSTGTLGLGGATNDYVAITGVQLEVGTVATPFEHRSYGEELALCQRYYQVIAEGNAVVYGIGFWWASNEINFSYGFRSEMRATPSLVQVTGSSYHRMENHGTSFNGWSGIQLASTKSANFYAIGLSGGTAGYAGNLSTKNSAAYFAIDAEL